MIQAPLVEGKSKKYFCHTREELQNVLTYSEDFDSETNPNDENLPVVEQGIRTSKLDRDNMTGKIGITDYLTRGV